MRVFVTGASGLIGSAITKELISAGHQVIGLARSDASAQAIIKVGAQVHRGDLDDLESLKKGALQADGIIHTAFKHDMYANPTSFAAHCETDRRAIETLGSVLVKSDRPFIVTSGTGVSPGRLATEDDPAPANPRIPRVSDATAMALAASGVKVSVACMPRSVHGEGDQHGFVPRLIAIARSKGVSAYIGEGLNRWPAVHRLDAGHLYACILEKGSKGGRYFAVGDEGVSTREIAEAIGRQLKLPVVSKSPAEAADHFGPFLSMVLSLDCPASSVKTQQLLGWRPTQIGLLADIEGGCYFKNK